MASDQPDRLIAPYPGNPYTAEPEPEPDQLVTLFVEARVWTSAWEAEAARWAQIRAWFLTCLLTLGAVGAVALFVTRW